MKFYIVVCLLLFLSISEPARLNGMSFINNLCNAFRSDSQKFTQHCISGDVEKVKEFLADPNFKFDNKSPFPSISSNFFGIIIYRQQTELLQLLISDDRIKIVQDPKNSDDPLLFAMEHSHIDLIQILLASPRIKTTGYHYLHYALFWSNIHAFKAVVESGRFDINELYNGFTCLDFVAANSSKEDFAAYILKKGGKLGEHDTEEGKAERMIELIKTFAAK